MTYSYPSSDHFEASVMKPRVSVANAGFRLHFISVLISFVSMANVFEFGCTIYFILRKPSGNVYMLSYIAMMIGYIFCHDLVIFSNITKIIYHYRYYII